MQEGSGNVCPACNKKAAFVTDPDTAEVLCCKCGLVITDKIITPTQQEYGSFNSAKGSDNTIITLPSSLARHDVGVSTLIAKTNKDAHGNGLDKSICGSMDRLRKWNFRSQFNIHGAMNLYRRFQELHTLKDKLGLPDAVIEKTVYIYRRARQRRLTLGRSNTVLLAAAAYVSCRELGVPKTLHDIAIASNVKRKVLSKEYRLLVTELDLTVPVVEPAKCIAKVANQSNVSEKTKRKALTIMRLIVTQELSAGKNPMGFAASIIYLASLYTGEKKNQAEIANAAGVTEVTLRNRYNDLKRTFGLDSSSLSIDSDKLSI
jgi:transcription initiation factor TFIIB